MNQQYIMNMMKEHISKIIGVNAGLIDSEQSFVKLGLTSIQTLKVVNSFRRELGIEISPVAMFEHKNIRSFSRYVLKAVEGCCHV